MYLRRHQKSRSLCKWDTHIDGSRTQVTLCTLGECSTMSAAHDHYSRRLNRLTALYDRVAERHEQPGLVAFERRPTLRRLMRSLGREIAYARGVVASVEDAVLRGVNDGSVETISYGAE